MHQSFSVQKSPPVCSRRQLTSWSVPGCKPVAIGKSLSLQSTEPAVPAYLIERRTEMADVGGVASERLQSFIDRIERLEEEKKAMQNDIKDVFAEAKAAGFDNQIMRQILKLRTVDKADRQEQEHLLELYKRALGMD
jgi:uncharacterized protein (UPF0335 family)